MSFVNIGIQGAKGSFSEEAAKYFIKNNNIKKYNISYLISSQSVLEAVESGQAKYGIFAMENAQGGVVIESVKALSFYRCNIVEMFHIPISQNLLALNNIGLKDVKEVHSHEQASKQCKNYLAKNFWTVPLVETDDTAEAARRLSQGKLDSSVAVIGSRYCSKLYGLNVLEKDVHDLKENLTLFLSVEKIGDKL